MLFVLSPAKALDYETPLADLPAVSPSAPLFAKPTRELIAVLREKSPQEVAALMKLSDKLARLNVARYAAWQPEPDAAHTRAAVLAFNGDVYDGLSARTLTPAQLDWAQAHVCILSGLYGVLRPLDAMQPYRLEMGTRLATLRGDSLYAFWGTRLAEYLNERQAGEAAPVLVNLASQEYFKAVDRRTLKARVLECVFEDEKNGAYKIISFYAKRARGLMARYAIEQQARTPEALKAFDADGYAWAPEASTADRLVFRRAERAVG